MDWLAEGLMVTILGIATVFAVLIFISLILSVFGIVAKKAGKKETMNKPIVNTNTSQVSKTDENKINDDLELIAVITAAIAASERAKGRNIGPDRLVVRRLKRVSAWNKEAINEQQNSLF